MVTLLKKNLLHVVFTTLFLPLRKCDKQNRETKTELKVTFKYSFRYNKHVHFFVHSLRNRLHGEFIENVFNLVSFRFESF